MMKPTSYKLSIGGDHYCIVSDESPDAIHKAALLVDSMVKEIATKASHVEEKRVATLAALQIATQLVLLESMVATNHQRQQKLVERLENECLALLSRPS